MLCPHCSTNVHLHLKTLITHAYEIADLIDKEEWWWPPENYIYCYRVNNYICPACEKLVVLLEIGLGQNISHELEFHELKAQEILYPKFISRLNFTDVPERLNNDYLEAVAVLNVSPKASAALSRRILQDILHNYHNIKKKNLDEEIKEFVSLNGVPSNLAETVDAIRINDRIGEEVAKLHIVILDNLIPLEIGCGQKQEAIEHLKQSYLFYKGLYSRFNRHGDKAADRLITMAELFTELGDRVKASAAYNSALEIYLKLDAQGKIALILGRLDQLQQQPANELDIANLANLFLFQQNRIPTAAASTIPKGKQPPSPQQKK